MTKSDEFEELRPMLFAIAYRVLGTAADAEDAVQDAWIRWASADRSEVADPKAYLCRIVTNEVTPDVDSRSLAPRHCARSWLSDPIADVSARSMVPAARVRARA